jgi:uncharacterized protein (DUF952 family)
MARIFHITTASEVQLARQAGEYVPQAFDRDGFIHCSHASQVVSVANALYAWKSGLVLLEIEADLLPCRVVEENLDGGSELFPHVYRPLPASAIVRVHAFPCGADGWFTLPSALSGAIG